MKQKTYQTKRLVLRPLTLKDFKTWLLHQEKMRPAVDAFDSPPLPPKRRTREFFNKAIREQREQAHKDSRYVWNIFLKRSGELVGFLDIKPISRCPHQMGDIGYFVSNAHRKKGYAKEALRGLVPGAFNDLDLHRLKAVISPKNRASLLAAKSAGLYREGIKKFYWFEDGAWQDQVIFIATPELFR